MIRGRLRCLYIKYNINRQFALNPIYNVEVKAGDGGSYKSPHSHTANTATCNIRYKRSRSVCWYTVCTKHFPSTGRPFTMACSNQAKCRWKYSYCVCSSKDSHSTHDSTWILYELTVTIDGVLSLSLVQLALSTALLYAISLFTGVYKWTPLLRSQSHSPKRRMLRILTTQDVLFHSIHFDLKQPFVWPVSFWLSFSPSRRWHKTNSAGRQVNRETVERESILNNHYGRVYGRAHNVFTSENPIEKRKLVLFNARKFSQKFISNFGQRRRNEI